MITSAMVAAIAGAGRADRHLPPNAANLRTWLGTWATNFGRVFFYDIFRARSDVPGPNGEAQYYWALRGIWTMRGGGRSVVIRGVPDARDYETFSGCWTIATGPDRTDCAPILIYRTGDRITGGYWKPCPLATNCTDHHPWRGLRTEPLWVAGFRFTQHGLPDGHTTIPTQTGGAGALAWEQHPLSGERGRATHGSAVFNIDEIPGAPRLHLEIALREGSFLTLAGHRRLVLAVAGVVTSSNDPHCNPGRLAGLTITDGVGGVPDRIDLEIAGCRSEHWTSANPQRVRVHIERPRVRG